MGNLFSCLRKSDNGNDRRAGQWGRHVSEPNRSHPPRGQRLRGKDFSNPMYSSGVGSKPQASRGITTERTTGESLRYEEDKDPSCEKKKNKESEYEEDKPNKTKGVSFKYEEDKKITVQALYNYNPTTKGADDVEFKVGDVLEVKKEEGNRYFVEHRDSKKKGYVQKLYVSEPGDENVHQNAWYFGKISMDDAISVLENDKDQAPGTFLVRDGSQGGFAIYLLTEDPKDGIKKHAIRMTTHNQEKQGFYIKGSEEIYPSLDVFIQACQESKVLTSMKLEKPCKNPKVIEDITLDTEEPIGNGNFSQVFKGKWKGKTVAVKKLKKLKVSEYDWEREVKIMMEIQHKNLIQCYHHYIQENNFHIVLEWMEKGSLLSYLQIDCKGKTMSLHRISTIASEIVAGMMYLEGKGMIHRDLAARNVLVGSKNEIKIADFGLARSFSGDKIEYEDPACPFPVKWTAPESLENRMWTTNSDVWSFGIALFEIVSCGEEPYPDKTKTQVMMHVARGKQPIRPENTPDSIFEIMKLCWKLKPEERPTFKALAELFAPMLQNDNSCGRIPEQKISPPKDEPIDELITKSPKQEPEEKFESVTDSKDEKESGVGFPNEDQHLDPPPDLKDELVNVSTTESSTQDEKSEPVTG